MAVPHLHQNTRKTCETVGNEQKRKYKNCAINNVLKALRGAQQFGQGRQHEDADDGAEYAGAAADHKHRKV